MMTYPITFLIHFNDVSVHYSSVDAPHLIFNEWRGSRMNTPGIVSVFINIMNSHELIIAVCDKNPVAQYNILMHAASCMKIGGYFLSAIPSYVEDIMSPTRIRVYSIHLFKPCTIDQFPYER